MSFVVVQPLRRRGPADVDAARLACIASALQDGRRPVLEALLVTGCELLSVDGAVISVISDGRHGGAIAATAPGYVEIDELQFNFGEGPCVDAFASGKPVLEPDLELATARWPAYAPAVIERGVHAVFAFPLGVGAARLGNLNLYRVERGHLDGRDVRDAVSLANVAMHTLLEVEADLVPGALPDRLEEVVEHRAHVHQATGMIAAQLECDVATALSRLRARAWSDDRSIDDLATDVVARRLRFDGP